MDYAGKSLLFKALGDPTRLKIVDMIANGELCACFILKEFDITQPSLSHHMKILCDCGLVNGRKDGKWTYYSLDKDAVQNFKDILALITTRDENRDYMNTTCFEEACQNERM